MTHEPKSPNSQAESTRQTGTDQADVVLHMMKRDGIPLTRANYLAMAYPEGMPQPWSAELEAELPQSLRLR